MRIITIVFILLFSGTAFTTQAQSLNKEKETVINVIKELFEGYRQSDSVRVASTFLNGAMMQRVSSESNSFSVTEPRSVNSWLAYIGGGLEKMHDEPIWDYKVEIDGGLANVWTKYAFYLDGEFSHCGVDSFSLVNTAEGWKIFHIVDTSRKTDCNIPEEIKKKHDRKSE